MSLQLVVDNDQGVGRAVADRAHPVGEMTSTEYSIIAEMYDQAYRLGDQACKDILNDAIFQVQKILRGVAL